MKTNVTRILSLVLALMLAVGLFAGCGDDEAPETVTDVQSTVSTLAPVIVEVDEDDPYTISQTKDGKDVIILTPNADGSVTMTVAENTLLETFLDCVKAKEGYTIKVSTEDGEEVTDLKTVIAKGMVFEVIKDGEDKAQISFAIDVITQEEIKETIKEQENIDKTNSEILNPSKVPVNKPNPENPGDTSSEETPSKDSSVTEPPVNLSEVNIILSSTAAANYSTTDEYGQIWQTKLSNMETKKNIITTIFPLDSASATDIIVKEVMAGKASADVYELSLGSCRNAARKKAAANMYDSKTLNKSLFNTGVTQSATFNGKAFGVSFAAQSANPMGVIFNKELIKKYAPDYDIEKLYDEKKWTFEVFQKIAKLCTVDTDGNGKTDIHGFTSNTNIIGMALTSNAGGTALMKNGRVEATMCNDAGIAALEWCKDLYSKDKTWKYQSDIIACANAFANGEAAMFVSNFMFYSIITSQASFHVGYVLMPIGPDQIDYKNGTYDGSIYMVAKTKENRLDDVGLWLNEVAGISGALVNLYTKTMAQNGLDAHSQEVYRWVVNNMTPEFSSGPFSLETSAAVDTSVTSPTKSPSKVMESIKSQAQNECDDYYAPLYTQ